jgi:hypothetical protein
MADHLVITFVLSKLYALSGGPGIAQFALEM